MKIHLGRVPCGTEGRAGFKNTVKELPQISSPLVDVGLSMGETRTTAGGATGLPYSTFSLQKESI